MSPELSPELHTLNYVNDINGQVIARSVTGGPGSAKPVQYYHYYNGIMLGANGNNGNDRPDMATALNERIAASPTTPGIFRGGATSPNPYADFDQAYDAVSPETFSQGPSAYTVRGGDSLESIAAQIWGDASLWYMLAEANPSASRGSLTVGTSLIIPNKVANFHNTSDTFRPYDAERAVGDTQPGTPKPPKANKGCGAIGAILIAVIAIAVTAIVTAGIGAIATGASFSSSFSAVLGGSLAGLTGTAAGATALGTAGAVGAGVLGAITGSAISQAFGVATGLQDKFSWKGVALAGLTAGIGGGLDGIGAFARLGVAGTQGASGVFNAVVRAAITNTVTQGVAVATKLQDNFSFTSVAAAGVAAGVASAVSQNIGGAATADRAASKLNRLISGVAATIAGGATRSAIDGTDFGDNIISTLPDVVASLLSYGLEEIASQPNARGAPAPGNHEEGHAVDTPEAGDNANSVGQATNDAASAVTDASQADLVPNALAGLDFGPFDGIAIDPDTAILTPAERAAKARALAQAAAASSGGGSVPVDASGGSITRARIFDPVTSVDTDRASADALFTRYAFNKLDSGEFTSWGLSGELAREYFINGDGSANTEGMTDVAGWIAKESLANPEAGARMDGLLAQWSQGVNYGPAWAAIRGASAQNIVNSRLAAAEAASLAEPEHSLFATITNTDFIGDVSLADIGNVFVDIHRQAGQAASPYIDYAIRGVTGNQYSLSALQRDAGRVYDLGTSAISLGTNYVSTQYQRLDRRYNVTTRAVGLAQGVTGTLGALAAGTAAVFTAPTVVGAVGFGGLAVIEGDQAIAGFRTLFSGEQTNSFLAQGISNLTGVSANNADLTLSLTGGATSIVGGGRVVASRLANRGVDELPNIGGRVPHAGGVIRDFTQEGDQIYYRVYTDKPAGGFLTAVPPRSSEFAREALALPPANQATFLQEVLVPSGTSLQRSRALPAFGRRGGAEQFELTSQIPRENFLPGRRF